MSGEGREDRAAAARRRQVPAEVLEAAMALVNTLAGNRDFRNQIADEEIAARIEHGDLIETEKLSIAPGLVLVPKGRIPELEAAARRVVKAWMDIPNEQGWTDEEVVLSRAVKGLAALFLDEFDSEEPADTPGADDTPEDEPVAIERDSDEEEHVTVAPVKDDDQAEGAAFSTSDEEPNHEAAPESVAVDRDPGTANTDFVPSNEGGKPEIGQVSDPEPVTSDASGSATLPESAETGNGAVDGEGAGTPGKPIGMPDKDDRGPCEQCGAAITEDDQARLSWILSRRKLCRSCHTGEAPQTEEESDGAPGDT